MICCEPGSGLGWEWVLTPRQPALEQATRFAWSLARGGPNRDRIAFTVLGDKVREHI